MATCHQDGFNTVISSALRIDIVYYNGCNRDNTLIMYGNNTKTAFPTNDPRDAVFLLRIDFSDESMYMMMTGNVIP